MEFSNKSEDGILFIDLQGDLIGENSGIEMMDIVNDKINAGIRLCTIDLSQVRYMNSSGIGVLITMLTKFRNKGGEVVLINPSEQIRKLLLITKLNSIFTIVDSADKAKEHLKK